MTETPRHHMPTRTLRTECLNVPVNIHETEIAHLFEYVHLKVCVYKINSASTCLCLCMFFLMCASACFTCVGGFFLGVHVLTSLCALMLSTVWPSLVLPAVLTLGCVDSKHSCRSQRPSSGRTRGSEGQWGREHTGSVNVGKGRWN